MEPTKKNFVSASGAIWGNPPTPHTVIKVDDKYILKAHIPPDLAPLPKIYVSRLTGEYDDKNGRWKGKLVYPVIRDNTNYYELKGDVMYIISLPSTDGKVYSNYVRVIKDGVLEYLTYSNAINILSGSNVAIDQLIATLQKDEVKEVKETMKEATESPKSTEKVASPKSQDVITDDEIDDLLKDVNF